MSEFERNQNRSAENSLIRPALPERTAAEPAHEVNPQPWGNQAARQFSESCPRALPSPGLCPFGGACRTCPARVQAKLTVSRPDDPYEQEADRVAEQVMSMPEPKVQRACPSCEDENVQTKPIADQITPLVQRQEEEPEEEEEPAQAKPDADAVQRQEENPEEEEEPVQAKSMEGVVQRQEESEEEEEPVQGKAEDSIVQRQEESEEEEEPVQGKAEDDAVQRQEESEEEEEPVQAKASIEAIQRQEKPEEEEEPVQTKSINRSIQRQEDPKEEEEPVQTKSTDGSIHRQEGLKEEEEPVQTKSTDGSIHRQEGLKEKEEPVQTKSTDGSIQRQEEEEPIQAKPIDGMQRQAKEYEEEEPIQTKSIDSLQVQRSNKGSVQVKVSSPQKSHLFIRQAELEEEKEPKEEKEEPEEEDEKEPIRTKLMEGIQIRRKKEWKDEESTIRTNAENAEIFCRAKELEKKRVSRIKPEGKRTNRSIPAKEFLSARELTSGGFSLPESLRTYFQKRFRRDLSTVRIHNGSQAESYSASLRAHAFTLTNHIWLGKGMSIEPSFTLAHEMTHFVQQQQPPELNYMKEKRGNVPIAKSYEKPLKPTVMFDTTPYWIPYDRRLGKPMSGSQIHNELLGAVKGKKNIDVEAPVPNAIRNNFGPAYQGLADLYKASTRVGVYFIHDHEYSAAKHFRAGADSCPRIDGNNIVGINKGPNKISIGELKPASKTELSKGNEQLNHYTEGFLYAMKLVNQWARVHGIARSLFWKLKKRNIVRLQPGEVSIPSRYQFSGTPKSDLFLGLGDIVPTESTNKIESAKYVTRKVWPDAEDLQAGLRVRGGLYLAPYKNGLWMYFARPANLEKSLSLPFRKKDIKDIMVTAQKVQDEVISEVQAAPKALAGLWECSSNFQPRGTKDSVRITTDKTKARVMRRSTRNVKLVDNFKYGVWANRQKQLGNIVRANQGKGTSSDKIYKFLRLLEFAYEAEEGLRAVPNRNAGTNLPPKSQMVERFKSKRTGKFIRKSLTKIYSWLSIWTGLPVRNILGKLREVFGVVFVRLANNFESLKIRIQHRVKELFNRDSAAKTKRGGYAAIAVRAMARILTPVMSILLRQTSNVLTDSLSRGLKDRLSAMLPFQYSDLQKASQDGFSKYKSLTGKVEEFNKIITAMIGGITTDFISRFAGVNKVLEKVKKVATLIQAAVVIVQCGTPPVWGCLKLLLKKLTEGVIEKALSFCWAQRQIAKIFLGIDFFKNLPASLAKYASGKINGILQQIHPQLSPIFAKITIGGTPSASEMGCGGGPSDEQMLLAELMDHLGEEKYLRLMEHFRQAGIPDDTPLSKTEINEIRKIIKMGRFDNMDKFLNSVKKNARTRAMKQLREKLQQGAFKDEFKAMESRKHNYQIDPLNDTEVKQHKATGKRFLHIADDGRRYIGLADVEVEECKGLREATIKFVRVQVTDLHGQTVDLGLAGRSVKGTLQGARCPR